jgi:hypothetical protein
MENRLDASPSNHRLVSLARDRHRIKTVILPASRPQPGRNRDGHKNGYDDLILAPHAHPAVKWRGWVNHQPLEPANDKMKYKTEICKSASRGKKGESPVVPVQAGCGLVLSGGL